MIEPEKTTSTSASYLIGVDTGGTYTDAAIIEARGHRVVASAKAITTKGDLAIGVAEAKTVQPTWVAGDDETAVMHGMVVRCAQQEQVAGVVITRV